MRHVLTIGLVFLFRIILPAQTEGEGSLVIRQDALIDTILNDYQAMRLDMMNNPEQKGIPGYRIQIFFDSGLNSSNRAGKAREEFLLQLPDIPAYVSWKAPNYRVRVGDFRTKLEAERALQTIIIYYPNAWVIKDEINFPLIN